MAVVLITGAAGLIGSEAARFFAGQGFDVVGIDNDMRRYFFGDDGSTAWRRAMLERDAARLPPRRRRHPRRSRHGPAVRRATAATIALVIHTAAQPSHDWAAREPITDFTVNANGTLVLLEMTRRHCPDAPFIFTSTNKVYGDTPNRLPLVERETRWAVDDGASVQRARHRRDDEHRREHAQRVRRLEGRRRRHGAGVRALLRAEDRLLPRRLPDRARAIPAPSCTASCRIW